MAPLSSDRFSLLLSIFCAITFKSTVLGDCSFPATYTNKFWFRMYSDATQQKYYYRIFSSNVDDLQNDNATFLKYHYPCSSIVTDSSDPNTVYYLYDDYGIPTCAKSVITSDSSSILLQEVSVNSTVTDASQCSALIVPSGSLWMSVVTSLSQPPPFASFSACPFPGLFQMTASLSTSSSTIECSGDVQSTAIFYGSNVQLNLCGQGALRNTTFKSKTILQDPLTCMASLDGRALNSNETGSTVVLLRDSNAIYCARYRNVSVGLELLINVKNDANYAGCSFTATSANPVLQLILTPVTSTPGLPTTTTPLSTASLSVPTTTSTAASPASSTTTSTSSTTTSTSSTVTGSSTSSSTVTGTGSTTTSTTTTTSITTPASVPTSSTSLPTSSTSLPTTPFSTPSTTTPTTPATTQSTTTTTTISTTSLVTPGPTLSTSPGVSSTTRGSSKGPPEEVGWPSDNCPAIPCGAPATCNEATHNCTCQTVFYTYSSNSSRCIQDDRSIDDTFLKIVVPIIATAVIGSLIAALALCFATRSLDATALDGAALAAASADGAAPAAAAAGPAVQPPQTLPQENPVFVSYGRNDTYANLDTIDRSLVTYGDQPNVAPPPVPPSNYVLVGSSIPAKM